MDLGNAAESEDHLEPVGLEGVAEMGFLDMLGGVGCMDDQRGFGFEETYGFGAALAIRDEVIGTPGAEAAIAPAAKDGGRGTPPIGVDHGNAVGGFDFAAVLFDVEREGGVAFQFRCGHDGVKAFGVEVVEDHLVAGVSCGLSDAVGDGVIKAVGFGVGEDDEDVHGWSAGMD